jgi:hypothetical protein
MLSEGDNNVRSRVPLFCLAVLFLVPFVPWPAQERIQLVFDSSEADAVLAILAARASGSAVDESHWQRLFATEPYVRLKRREEGMKRGFTDADFRAFVLSDALLARRSDLERALAAWKAADLQAQARRMLEYLPANARIRAKVYAMIKPKTNSFVFEMDTDPTVFLYLDPQLTRERFENTVAHELHHIGLASVEGETEKLLAGVQPLVRTAVEYMGAFGEGMAMLAAAGGADVHPHLHSEPADRERWDRDVANVNADLKLVERFFLDVIAGRLEGAAIRQQAMTFFGVQGPWYTVGWKMAAMVERRFGRAALIECMIDPRLLLERYNEAAAEANRAGAGLALWSEDLLAVVRR